VAGAKRKTRGERKRADGICDEKAMVKQPNRNLFVCENDSFVLERTLVPTGLFLELPVGYEAQIRPRSGLALKHNIGLMNSPGTIDSDYRGEVKIVFTNFGKNDFIVKRGDRIAQMVIAKYERVEWVEADQLSDTKRGAGGFGHTGISQQ